MRREAKVALLGALGWLGMLAGCLTPYEEPGLIEDALQDLRRTTGGRRPARWLLAKIWVEEVPAEEDPPEGAVPLGEGAVFVAHSEPPGRRRDSSILVREGETGFLALLRGGQARPLHKPKKAGDAEFAAPSCDRGLEARVTLERGGGVTARLVPVFRELPRGGLLTVKRLAFEELAFDVELPEGEAVVLDSGPAPKSPTIRRLFFRKDGASRLRMSFQVTVVR